MALTKEQQEWVNDPYESDIKHDSNHTFHILVHIKHFPEWFASKPTREEVEDDYENNLDYDDCGFEFDKFGNEWIQLTHRVPKFWTDPDVEREDLENAILKKLYLKPEWVEMTCDG